MATAANLVQRTRRFLGDWPETDALAGAVALTDTTVTVADSSIYSVGFTFQVDTEAFYVSALPSATTLTVRRGVRGTTAAAHTSGTTIILRPHFFDIEYLDALNAGIGATFPLLYQAVVDESTTLVSSVYEYPVPLVGSIPIPYISELQVKITGDLTFRDFKAWDVLRGGTPTIKLRRAQPPGTLRVYGFGPLPYLVDLTDSTSSLFPQTAEAALIYYAAQYLLASGEARRVREDTGARDDRENANRLGGSIAASQQVLQRFLMQLEASRMPPMPKHIKSVL